MTLSPRWRWKLDRWKEQWLGWFLPGERQEGRPRLCPSCGQLAGVNARRCPNCGASMTYSLAAASQTFSRLLPSNSPATYGLFSLCCLLYGISLLLTLRAGQPAQAAQGLGSIFNIGAINSYVLLGLGARQTIYILSGHQWWRLVTPIFLHAALFHLGMNMWVLVDIGPMVEEIYGTPRFLYLFILTGVCSWIASTVWNIFAGGGYGLGMGASGALMGLIGLLLAVTSRGHSIQMQMLRSQLVRWIFYIVLLGVLMPGIDNAAHFGGLVSGFLIGRIVNDRPPATPAEQKLAYALGWTAGLVVAASFLAMLAQFIHIR
ncbi:MAG TPA: rhomboid family intramembrane serine protease [Candidatus Acidoferrales bacterium]|nr:rhomboid family intramembrane serine protease [Candidatus Acidoferrales bacterium]